MSINFLKGRLSDKGNYRCPRYDGCSLTVKTLGCGPRDEGSTPSFRPAPLRIDIVKDVRVNRKQVIGPYINKKNEVKMKKNKFRYELIEFIEDYLWVVGIALFVGGLIKFSDYKSLIIAGIILFMIGVYLRGLRSK